MGRQGHTFYLHDDDPREAALHRRLGELAEERAKGPWIVETLLAAHQGARGVDLETLNRKLDQVLSLLQSGATATPESSAPQVKTGDGISYLDTLGI